MGNGQDQRSLVMRERPCVSRALLILPVLDLEVEVMVMMVMAQSL